MKISDNDRQTLAKRGITETMLEKQLNDFAQGFPYLKIIGAATPGNGIEVVTPQLAEKAVERWDKYLADGGSVTKFVPASGAASRMFKAMFAFVNGADEKAPAGSDAAEIIAKIDSMPFYDDLNAVLAKLYGKDAKALIADGRDKEVISAIINPEGLNYGNLPKGLLKFHSYTGEASHTPVEEQLMEGAQSAATNGKVDVHFTVSENHQKLFDEKIKEVLPSLEARTGVKYNVTMSTQSPSTDTVAVNPDNTLFRDKNGNMVFRPGGHGALIKNLGDINSEVIFIKNIDNVVPDVERGDTIKYKKIIAGVLMLAFDKIAGYMSAIKAGDVTDAKLAEMLDFTSHELCISNPQLSSMTREEKLDWLYKKFDRPLRVCGMVRNEGEPGGGPYIAVNADGTASPQILESSQIDLTNPTYRNMMQSASHFNPVDLVCHVTRPDGTHYNLPEYVDPATGFISSKSLEGRELRALELPGLWNGAMSDWNTIFVEVPITTFNPVKTVNDLLRPVHQALSH